MTSRVVVVMAALSLLASGCGTRKADRDTAAAAAEKAPSAPGAAAAAASPGSSAAAPETPAAVSASAGSATGSAGAATGSAGAGSTPAAGGTTKAQPAGTSPAPATASGSSSNSPKPAAAPAPAGSKPAGSKADVSVAPGPGGPPAPGAPGGARDTSPIIIGSIGTLSGPAGDTIRRTYEGVQVWTAAMKAQGGIYGHPVKQIVLDDAGDPARYKAGLRQLVESEKVVAFVGNPDALTGYSGVDYIKQKGVPYIGGDGGGDWFYSTPFHFPQGPVGATLAEAEVRDAAAYGKTLSKKKFGTIACTEADICRALDKVWNEKAAQYGLDPVYRGRTSLVQPDFTAECLAAQRQGVELLEVGLDSNSVGRLANSCSRQGFHPIFGYPAGIARDTQQDDPNLEGARSTLPTFSWIQNDSPAAQEYQDAMRRFGKSLGPQTAGHSGGWTAAKLFEAGVRAGGTAGPVTVASVLAGLYTFKNETLGGLAPPLTFTAGQTAPRILCTSQVVIKDHKWHLIDNGKFHCS